MVHFLPFCVIASGVILTSFIARAEILPNPTVIASSPVLSLSTAVPANLFDGKVSEYASNGVGTNTFVTMDFGVPVLVDRFVLMTRRTLSAVVGSYELQFSADTIFDSSDPIHTAAAAGSFGAGPIFAFPATTARYVRWKVVTAGVGSNQNLGGVEMRFLRAPQSPVFGQGVIAPAVVIASSPAFNANYANTNAVDGKAGIGDGNEYASAGAGTGTFVDFDLGAARPILSFDFFDRLTPADRALQFKLSFSNDPAFPAGAATSTRDYTPPGTGWGYSQTLAAPLTARYVRYQVTARITIGASSNQGISEMIFYTKPPTSVGNEAQLRSALASLPNGDTLNFTANITLAGISNDLPALEASGVTINGNGFTLNGANTYRGFFVYSGSTSISNLTFQNCSAKGGSGGGGGAGMGGALFVRAGATLNLSNAQFINNSAQGGAGNDANFAGGGGLGGNGGSGGSIPTRGGAGGGGGIGRTANGSNSAVAISAGSVGIISSRSAFGGGGGGQNGSPGNGTAGTSVAGSRGGAGLVTADASFGGGGGGSTGDSGDMGQDGAFGGGGGNHRNIAASGGKGGYGGGGGYGGVSSTATLGGFGGGTSTIAGGGGGAGLGGALFGMAGATIQFSGPISFNGNTVTAGTSSSAALSAAGSAAGAGIFLQGNGSLTLAPGTGETQTLSGIITDETGSGLVAKAANSVASDLPGGSGQWGIAKTGAGTLALSGTQQFTGPTTISNGTFALTGSTKSLTTIGNGAVLAPASITTFSNGLTLLDGSAIAFDLGTTSDRINITGGTLTGPASAGGTTFNFSAASTAALGTYTLIDFTGRPLAGVEVADFQASGLQGNSTFSLTSTALTITIASATQSGYPSWAATNGLTAGNSAFETDAENDGFSNGMEFILGGNPLVSDAATIRPTSTLTATDITLTFKRSHVSKLLLTNPNVARLQLQTSTDLQTWIPTDVPADTVTTSGILFTVAENGTAPDTITATIPRGTAPRQFIRLFGELFSP